MCHDAFRTQFYSIVSTCKLFFSPQDAPSCSKQISAFDDALDEYKALGVRVVGVRNEGGVKDSAAAASVALVVDEADAVRNELAIPKDFFILGAHLM